MSRLVELAVGERGRISGVTGDDEITIRLLEMGLTPGIDFALIGKAPLGDPLELELRGYRLCVRRTEAARIEVEKY